MSGRTPISVDVGRLVGLVGPGAWVLFGFFAVTQISLALLGGGEFTRSPAGITALAVIVGAGAVLTAPSVTPLPLWRVAVAFAAVAAATLLVSPSLPTSGSPGFAAWHLGACSFLLFAMALRARVAAAWVGMAMLMALTLGWSTLATGTPWYGLSISYAQPVSLLAGTVFSLGLYSAARQITEFNDAQRRAAAAEVHQAEREARRRDELSRLRLSVEPTLLAIAGGTLGDGDRAEVGMLEASLRDRIRGRMLAAEPLTSQIDDARRSGCEVLVLDDTGSREPAPAALIPAVEWITSQLRTVEADEITIRLTWEDDVLVATVTTDDADLRCAIPA